MTVAAEGEECLGGMGGLKKKGEKGKGKKRDKEGAKMDHTKTRTFLWNAVWSGKSKLPFHLSRLIFVHHIHSLYRRHRHTGTQAQSISQRPTSFPIREHGGTNNNTNGKQKKGEKHQDFRRELRAVDMDIYFSADTASFHLLTCHEARLLCPNM